jgi:hypothetical protein
VKKKEVDHSLWGDKETTKLSSNVKRNQLYRKNSLKTLNRPSAKYPPNFSINTNEIETKKFSAFRPNISTL